jgi:signal transduction histidine kinase
VLINLLTNAIKYAPNATNIAVACTIKNDRANISVKDEGIGISKLDQDKIFERFYRVEGKNEQTYPGFGIGLFIAAEILKKHNGNIQVESELGKGAVFSFSLPLYK